MKTTIYAVSSAIASLLLAGQATAHVTFATATAKPGSTVVLQLQLPHGCDGKATTELQVKLPDGFYGAKPQPKAGWELEVIKGTYARPSSDHGTPVTSGATEIRWKNGNLSDDFYDTFVIQGKFDGVAEGAVLAFPIVQICGTDRAEWTQVAAPGVDAHSLKTPAPTIKITGDDKAAQTMATASLGSLTLRAGFVKAMLPGQPVGGGYITIENAGSGDDKLVAVSSPAAGEVELHEMAMVNDVMKMRRLEGGIALPAGKTTELKPGGYHMMFQKVREPFKEGGKVPVTLTFEKAGKIEITLPVTSAAPGGGHEHN